MSYDSRLESLEDRSLLTPTVTLPDPNSQIFTRPGGDDFTWTYSTGTTPADGSVNRYPVTAVAYYDVPAFNWNLTRGSIEYATSTAGPWTTLVNNPSDPQYQSVSGKVFRFVDTSSSDTTTSNNVGVGWQLGGGAPGGNVGSGTQVIPDNAPTDITSNRSVILDDASQGDVLATLTPTDTGYQKLGRWVIDSQSVANLFTLNHDNTQGNTAKLVLSTGTMPAVGQTATVTARYYDIFQTDDANEPINGEGFSKTLTFTVVANDTNSLTTFEGGATANTHTSDYQQNPAVATLSDGNYVVVWQSSGQDKANINVSGIYGQIFSNTGAAVGSEFLVANNSTTSDEILPAVTALNSGRFAVAYATKAGSNYEIGVRIIEANGTVGSEIIANESSPGEDQYSPSIATLTDGSFVVSWVNYTTGDLKLQKFAGADGAKIGANELVVAANGYVQSVSALSNGEYIAAWGDYSTNKVSFRIGSGSAVETTLDISTSAPRIAPTSNGFVLVSDPYDYGTNLINLVGARYSNAGVLQGSSFAVSSTASGNQTAPTIATLSDGGFVVAWTSSTVDQIYNGIAGRRFDSSGTAIDNDDFQINRFRAQNQLTPAITALANGGFATAWSQQPDIDSSPQTDIDVLTRVFNAVSATPNVDLSVSATSGTESGETQITITATADSAVSSDQTVDLAVTGTNITAGDYTLTDGDTGVSGIQIKILSGQTTGTVTFTVVNDTLLEGDETADLTISNPTSGFVLGTVTSKSIDLSDDETATLDIEATSSAAESGGTQSVGTVTLSITGSGTGTYTLGEGVSLTADISDALTGTATSGTDYSTFSTQTVTFNNGATTGATQSASLSVTGDSDLESNETVALVLSNLGGSSVSSSLGTTSNVTTIADDDTPVPTVTIGLSDTSLKIGDTSKVTFTFNTPVTGFTNDDITIQNGVLSTVSSSDGGTTWSAVLTPTSNIEDTTNVVTVDKTGVLNGASVAGTGTTNSSNYRVDTKRPTANISLSDSALGAGETSVVTITFSEAVVGLTVADFLVENGDLSSLSSGDGGITWTATFTPSTNVNDATNVITLDNTGLVDLSGNFGTGSTDSGNYSVDTIAPTGDIVDISPDPRTINAGAVSINFNEDVSGVDIADFTLTRDMNAVDISGLSVSGSGKAYTLDLSTVTKAEGEYVLTLAATGANILDAANNSFAVDASDSWSRIKPTVDLSVDSNSINEGSGAIVTVTLSSATEDDVTVNVTIGGTANSKNDYTVGTTPIVISAGQTTATLAIDASDDTFIESDETVTVTLDSLTNADNGTATSLSITLVDTDSAPITAVATNGVLVITVVQQVSTDVRVTLDSNQYVVGSYVGGVLETTFLIDTADVTNGLQAVLGTEADAFDASGISLTTTIQAGNGNDTIIGSTGADSVDGGDGNDLIALGSGDDSADGAGGNDTIRAGAGRDQLSGGIGDDNVSGQGGVDVLSGGLGIDVLDGGASGTAIIDDFAGNLTLSNTGYRTARGDRALGDLIGYATLTGSTANENISTRTFTGLATVLAGDGIDTLEGGTARVSFFGEGGVDYLTGSSADDYLSGGDGNDILIGLAGNDVLTGGSGDDTVSGNEGNDALLGGSGTDSLAGGIGDDTLRGNGSNDYLNGNDGNDQLFGGDGDDTLTGSAGDDRLDGEVGNDQVSEGLDTDFTIVGLNVSSPIQGNDTARNIEWIALTGGSGANQLDARLSSVPVILNGSNDNDTLLGSTFNDTLIGDTGNDSLNGGDGNDLLRGGAGNDMLTGGAGNDAFSGGAGIDRLYERLDVDATINGVVVTAVGLGTDSVDTTEGIVLVGLGAANTFNASASSVSVTLLGGEGDDTLIGSSRADVLVGGNRANPAAGTDSLTGGAGVDILDNDTDDAHIGTGDSVLADVFSTLPSWIDAL